MTHKITLWGKIMMTAAKSAAAATSGLDSVKPVVVDYYYTMSLFSLEYYHELERYHNFACSRSHIFRCVLASL